MTTYACVKECSIYAEGCGEDDDAGGDGGGGARPMARGPTARPAILQAFSNTVASFPRLLHHLGARRCARPRGTRGHQDRQGPWRHRAYIPALSTKTDGEGNAKPLTIIYLDFAVQVRSKSQHPDDTSLLPQNKNRHLFNSGKFHHFNNYSKD